MYLVVVLHVFDEMLDLKSLELLNILFLKETHSVIYLVYVLDLVLSMWGNMRYQFLQNLFLR